MLRACAALLKRGGRLGFYTIYIPTGLPADAYERAKAAGPRAAEIPEDHEKMILAAGFQDVREIDVTAQYVATIRALLASRSRHETDVRRELGDEEFERRATENRNAVSAIEAQLLRRSLFLARRPR